MSNQERSKIAVIGGGVAGIVASYLLQKKHEVTLFEKNDYIGGHTNTITIDDGPDQGTPVDTGFIVLNDKTYPLLNRFLSQLNVAVSKTDMSFGYTDRKSGMQYASSDFNGLFAERSNLFRPSYWDFLLGILKFNRVTRERLHEGKLSGCTLGEHLRKEGIREKVAKDFVLPMAGAVWSAPDGRIMEFPAETFARFYENHGLLSVRNQPQWYFIPGGSQTYVKAFIKDFKGRIITECPVAHVMRTETGVFLKLPDGSEEIFDRVVIAAHADEALKILADPSPEEVRLLSAWRYSANHTVLHHDIAFMPPNRRAWASWNYIREADAHDDDPVTLTYDMTRLQRLQASERYCVTLNPQKPVSAERVIREIHYTHPIYSFEAIATQEELARLNGYKNTYFCGSYFGYGFHEDAVRAASNVGTLFGIAL
jgi:predicted NAD/FAD-binding protein